MFSVRLAGDYLYGKKMALHPSVAGDVFDGVLFCVVLFPTRCL